MQHNAERLAGSPPHAGKGRALRDPRTGDVGLTPARGEGTLPKATDRSRARAHPRTRGRDKGIGNVGPQVSGSPPHAGKGP